MPEFDRMVIERWMSERSMFDLVSAQVVNDFLAACLAEIDRLEEQLDRARAVGMDVSLSALRGYRRGLEDALSRLRSEFPSKWDGAVDKRIRALQDTPQEEEGDGWV
jgi:hypothetical protein